MPKAEEGVAYNMPAYRLSGEVVLYFAAWKNHFSLYPASDGIVTEFKDELAPYTVEKGTIRFPLSDAPPAKLIERIARFRAAEVAKQ